MEQNHVRFGSYLKVKSNFLKFSLLTMGTMSALVLLYIFGGYGGFVLWIVLVASGLLTGLLWGILMWIFFVRSFARPESAANRNQSERHAP